LREYSFVKVFISYSTANDQIVALRIQTLAAVYGVTVFVPGATTRKSQSPALPAAVQEQLRDSDVVLAVMMDAPSPAAVSELNLALAIGKLLIPILGPSVSSDQLERFQPHFRVDPLDPSRTENEIVSYLAGKQQNKQHTALLAVLTLTLALFLFAKAK